MSLRYNFSQSRLYHISGHQSTSRDKLEKLPSHARKVFFLEIHLYLIKCIADSTRKERRQELILVALQGFIR